LGWTYTYKPGHESVFEFSQRRFNYESNDERYGKVIDCAVVKEPNPLYQGGMF